MEIEPGELLADRPELRIVLLADTEGLCITYFRFEAGRKGRSRMCTGSTPTVSWFSMGRCTLQLRDEGHRGGVVGPGAARRGALVRSTTDEVAFLNVHAPSCSSGRTSAESAKGLTSSRAEGAGATATAVVCRLGGSEGETITDRPGRW